MASEEGEGSGEGPEAEREKGHHDWPKERRAFRFHHPISNHEHNELLDGSAKKGIEERREKVAREGMLSNGGQDWDAAPRSPRSKRTHAQQHRKLRRYI